LEENQARPLGLSVLNLGGIWQSMVRDWEGAGGDVYEVLMVVAVKSSVYVVCEKERDGDMYGLRMM